VFHPTFLEGADSTEIGGDVVFHAAVEPVNDGTEAFAFVEAAEHFQVLGADCAAELGVEVGGGDVLAGLHEVVFKDVAADGVIDVVDGAFVLHDKFDNGVYALLKGGNGGVVEDKGLELFGDDFLDESGEVVEVVIEGVAVDAAVLDDVLDGDLTERALVQELQEGLFDSHSGKVCHDTPPEKTI